jgi:hypothetical protein
MLACDCARSSHEIFNPSIDQSPKLSDGKSISQSSTSCLFVMRSGDSALHFILTPMHTQARKTIRLHVSVWSIALRVLTCQKLHVFELSAHLMSLSGCYAQPHVFRPPCTPSLSTRIRICIVTAVVLELKPQEAGQAVQRQPWPEFKSHIGQE